MVRRFSSFEATALWVYKMNNSGCSQVSQLGPHADMSKTEFARMFPPLPSDDDDDTFSRIPDDDGDDEDTFPPLPSDDDDDDEDTFSRIHDDDGDIDGGISPCLPRLSLTGGTVRPMSAAAGSPKSKEYPRIFPLVDENSIKSEDPCGTCMSAGASIGGYPVTVKRWSAGSVYLRLLHYGCTK
ncbi:uncharacterized protein LOC119362376 [Triticum dicoccoides]|uniref:uncharacterized protein LOC119362376 n=1 Tax=Triticum dicoccoides TaxID=85692 RepID=UPI000E7A2B30|nr:uncharacterized protein LOC119362376 [Triticum dicoccoides]